MNVPSIVPQLRIVNEGGVTDYVFVIIESEFDYKNPNGFATSVDVECYIDDEWNSEETMKGMSVQNAREWWNTLVHHGFERILTP
jgi:hypothetical protein